MKVQHFLETGRVMSRVGKEGGVSQARSSRTDPACTLPSVLQGARLRTHVISSISKVPTQRFLILVFAGSSSLWAPCRYMNGCGHMVQSRSELRLNNDPSLAPAGEDFPLVWLHLSVLIHPGSVSESGC